VQPHEADAAKDPDAAASEHDAMKALLILVLGLGLSCATVGPTIIPIAKHCGKTVGADVLPAIESALVAQDYLAELTALAVKFGECVVTDAVALIRGESVKDLGYASADVNAQIRVQHADAWLAAHPEN